jgi:quinol monooxygenase YgiN
MVTEIARYRAQPGKADDLANGLLAALDVFKRADGCRSIRLCRSVEDDQLFMYEIEWISVEYHVEIFRKGPLFTEYRNHINGLFIEPVDMMHFETIG